MRYDAQAPGYAESRVPTRAPSLRSDVAVPLAQSVMIGGLGAVPFAAAVALLAHDAAAAVLTWVGATAIFALTALRGRMRAVDASLWSWEVAQGRDLDGDGRIGQPVERPLILMNPARSREAVAAERRAAERERFVDFVRGAQADTSARRWEREIGRERLAHYRDALMAQGYADWRTPGDPRGGWTLTVPAQDIIDALPAE